ncbi:MAG: hypothetical protein AAB545_03425 [Patescibacteria group bacterium]
MNSQIEKRERISKGKAFLLYVVSLLFDVVQGLLNLIPFVGWVASSFLGIIGILLFFLWFKMLGVKFSDTKEKFLTTTAINLITIIPILGALPERFFGTILIIKAVRKEDALYNAKQEEGIKMEQRKASIVGAQNNRASVEQEEEKSERFLLVQRAEALERGRESAYEQTREKGREEFHRSETLRSIGVGAPRNTPTESLRRLAPRKTSTESSGENEERPLARYTIEKSRVAGGVPDEFRLRRLSARDVAEENQRKRNLLKKQTETPAQGGEQIPTKETPRGVTILDKLRQAKVA